MTTSSINHSRLIFLDLHPIDGKDLFNRLNPTKHREDRPPSLFICSAAAAAATVSSVHFHFHHFSLPHFQRWQRMASRGRTSHRLSGGLFVSGPPETKTKHKTSMPSTAVPYTGGDIKNSGELGKMFEIPGSSAANTTTEPVTGSITITTSSRPHSGPLSRVPTASTPKKISSSSSFSGPIALPATGLITSGPASASSSTRRSGGQGVEEQTPVRTGVRKKAYGAAVTVLGKEREYEFGISNAVVLVAVLVLVLLMTLGIFLLVAVKNIVMLGVALGLLLMAVGLVLWNLVWKHKGLQMFLRGLPDTDLYGAASDQFVKVSGVVTCGGIPLETSYQCIPRCAYVSTELYEYRGCNGKQAKPNHRMFTWGLRHSEKHVADFYISDSRRGIRALVKAGHGAKVVSFVKPTTKLEINSDKKDMYPTFTKWLENCSISSGNRIMRLEEAYIKEGSTVTVIGILERHENILMIAPPEEPISTGFLWRKFLLSMNVKGLILIGDDKPDDEVVTV